MARILGTRTIEDNKVIYEIELEHKEASQIMGYTENICVFPEEGSEIETNISQRGKNEATKYFLIPRILRNNLKYNRKVGCKKMETKNKTIFIYIIDKISKLKNQ